MSCQNKYSGNCPYKNDYRVVKGKKYPFECCEGYENNCAAYKPFPPPMTDKEFEQKQGEILKEIPIDFHGALSGLAWDLGHAYGYEEVIIHLQDLVSGLKDSIHAYGDRLLKP